MDSVTGQNDCSNLPRDNNSSGISFFKENRRLGKEKRNSPETIKKKKIYNHRLMAFDGM